MNLTMTDDEVVALGAIHGRLWPSVLPTVDGSDPSEVHAAADRGLRSLVLRGQVGRAHDGRPQPCAELDRVSRRVLSGPSFVWARARAGAPTAGTVLTYAYLETDGAAVIEIPAPNGLRCLGEIDRTSLRRKIERSILDDRVANRFVLGAGDASIVTSDDESTASADVTSLPTAELLERLVPTS